MQPITERIELNRIKPLYSGTAIEDLRTAMVAGSLSEAQEEQLIYIRRALAYYTYGESIIDLSLQITANGASLPNAVPAESNRKPLTMEEIRELKTNNKKLQLYFLAYFL